MRRAWYSGDTLVGGLQCQRIDQTIFAYEPVFPFGTPFTLPVSPIITNGQGDVVRIWDQLTSEFDTLAWFGAVPGDHWSVPQYLGPSAHFDVLDTGTKVVAGIPLHYVVIEEPIVMGFTDTLFERIGFERFYLQPFETMQLDIVTYDLVCYRDDDIDQYDGWVPGHPCDFTLAVQEEEVQLAPLFPNPGTDHFTLSLPPGSHTITVHDGSGRVLLQQRTADPLATIATDRLSAGIYLVRVDEGSLPWHWVKQ